MAASEPAKVIVYTREFSATDHDAYAKMFTNTGPKTVFSFVDATHDVRSAAITYSH